MTGTAYDGLLLDHDGVLVTLSPKSALRTATAAAFADAGIDAPRPADVETLSIGVSPAELREVATRYDVAPERLWRCREDRIAATLRAEVRADRKRPFDDVGALDDVAVPMGIASNNQTRLVEYVVRTYGLDHCAGTVQARVPTPESLRRKKPKPTYLDAAATDLDCSNPLYVGDSESDIVAGRRAGFDTVWLRRGHNADTPLSAEPTYVAESLAGVVEILQSPR